MEFQEGNYAYTYRDALKKNHLRQEYKLEINTRDLARYDEQPADKLKESPGEMMHWFRTDDWSSRFQGGSTPHTPVQQGTG